MSGNNKKCNLEEFFVEVLRRAESLQVSDVESVIMSATSKDNLKSQVFEIPNVDLGMFLNKKRIGGNILNLSLDRIIKRGFTKSLKDIYNNGGAISIVTRSQDRCNVSATCSVIDNYITNVIVPNSIHEKAIECNLLSVDFILS
jgi:hypothetical protein